MEWGPRNKVSEGMTSPAEGAGQRGAVGARPWGPVTLCSVVLLSRRPGRRALSALRLPDAVPASVQLGGPSGGHVASLPRARQKIL